MFAFNVNVLSLYKKKHTPKNTPPNKTPDHILDTSQNVSISSHILGSRRKKSDEIEKHIAVNG